MKSYLYFVYIISLDMIGITVWVNVTFKQYLIML